MSQIEQLTISQMFDKAQSHRIDIDNDSIECRHMLAMTLQYVTSSSGVQLAAVSSDGRMLTMTLQYAAVTSSDERQTAVSYDQPPQMLTMRM